MLFSSQGSFYLVDGHKTKEIFPFVEIKACREASPIYLGMINYRGAFVQVVDFEKLLTGKELVAKMHARIILLKRKDNSLVGLIVDCVESIIEFDQTDKILPLQRGVFPFIQNFIKKDLKKFFILDVDLFLQYIDGVL